MIEDMKSTTVRRRALAILLSMPDEASVDDVLSGLYFRLKIEQRLQEAREGRTVSHAEAKHRLRRWLSR